MVNIHGNYSPPCRYILHEVLKRISEAVLRLTRASFEICIPKLSGKRARQVLHKTSVFPQQTTQDTDIRALCPVL